MRKSKILFPALLLLFGPSVAVQAQECSLAESLSGRILLQVEANGEGWYVNPGTNCRVYLGRPEDALNVMRRYSLGVSDVKLASFKARAPRVLSGRILLKAEDKGQAYYVNPSDNKPYYLGRPEDALALMRRLGLGISNRDISGIPVENPVRQTTPEPAGQNTPVQPAPAALSAQPATPRVTAPAPDSLSQMEQAVFKAVNDYRLSKGLPALKWNDTASQVARGHSLDMAAGQVPFSHEGFDNRAATLRAELKVSAVGENVAYNQGYADPDGRAVAQWISSSGHEKNMSGPYALSGVGIARSRDGKYYFTQLFAK